MLCILDEAHETATWCLPATRVMGFNGGRRGTSGGLRSGGQLSPTVRARKKDKKEEETIQEFLTVALCPPGRRTGSQAPWLSEPVAVMRRSRLRSRPQRSPQSTQRQADRKLQTVTDKGFAREIDAVKGYSRFVSPRGQTLPNVPCRSLAFLPTGGLL